MAQIRSALLDIGFTLDAVRDRLGPAAFAGLGRGSPAAARRSTAAGPQDALAACIGLFLLGDDVPARGAAQELPLAALGGAGFIEASGDVLRGKLHIQPYPVGGAPAFAVSDFPTGLDVPRLRVLGPDHVTGVGGASITLATLTPRAAVGRTLDLGTGCGIQALLAAVHSRQVVATDVSDRALGLAAATASLSGADIELRLGSLFAPVAGETFDLIVANPPFVISPRPRYTYRETPLRGDDLTREVLQGAAQHLAPGGTAVVLGNWLHTSEGTWQDRVSQWAPPGCGVWIAERELLPVTEYVDLWLKDSADAAAGDAAQRAAEWLGYFDDLGASAVGFGWAVVRRGSDWCIAEDLAEADPLPTGEQVMAQLDHFDALAGADAVRLLAGSPTWTQAARLHRSGPAGSESVDEILATGDWRPAEPVDPFLERLLRIGGPLHERLAMLEGADGTDPDEALARALIGLRRLIGAGLVTLQA